MKMLRILSLPALAGLAGLILFLQRGTPPSSPPESPLTTAAVVKGGERWSKETKHYPGFPTFDYRREWSEWEIAQRHRALVMADLPEYITELRGAGDLHETDKSSASWFFVVPKERLADFAEYLVGLGVPRDALREEKFGELPAYLPRYDYDKGKLPPRPLPPEPATKLVFGRSLKQQGDGPLANMQFGPSVGGMTYDMLNPNILRATVRFSVAWDVGNVYFAEIGVNPD